jgi:predicted amidohydrolase
MNPARFIFFSLVLGIGLMPINLAGEEVKLVADPETRGLHLSADIVGSSIVVGAEKMGVAKIFSGSGRNWKDSAELRLEGRDPANPHLGEFGWAVSLSARHAQASANIAIVGAPSDLHGAEWAGDQAADWKKGMKGAAYIFARSGAAWKQQAKLAAADPEDDDRFGQAVSIDRSTAIVGVPKDDDAGTESGSAYIFSHDGTRWKQQAKLVPQDLAKGDSFGEAVVIRENVAIVGAPKHMHGGLRLAGAVYVFERLGETWVQQAKLTADDARKGDQFGRAIAMSGDTIIVGAPMYDSDDGRDAGAAYIFTRDGEEWDQQTKLIAKDTKPSDRFGLSVATNGKTAIVGAPRREARGLPASGAAYSFMNVDGVWQEKKQVTPDQEEQNITFGAWVAISGDHVVVSAHALPSVPPLNLGFGSVVYVYNVADDFDALPFSVEPFGSRVTTFGQVKHTALLQNFPNPFNPETWLPYRLAVDVPVTFRIYNLRGQLTRELDVGVQKAGRYLTRETAAYWDGKDGAGETVSSGVYFYTLQAGSFQATRRMLIVK